MRKKSKITGISFIKKCRSNIEPVCEPVIILIFCVDSINNVTAPSQIVFKKFRNIRSGKYKIKSSCTRLKMRLYNALGQRFIIYTCWKFNSSAEKYSLPVFCFPVHVGIINLILRKKFCIAESVKHFSVNVIPGKRYTE